ncbi:MAG: hypothetical protein ABR599_12270 [Gemmatimonadota bacterium]
MPQLPDLPGATAARFTPPPAAFERLLEKEVERSRRYYRAFALVLVEPAGRGPSPSLVGPAPAPPPGHEERAPDDWVARIPSVLRRADVVQAVPGGAVYVLLPETPASCLPIVTRRVEKALVTAGAAASHREGGIVLRQAAFPRDGDTARDLLRALAS